MQSFSQVPLVVLKVSTYGEGVKIAQNSVHVVCTRPQKMKKWKILELAKLGSMGALSLGGITPGPSAPLMHIYDSRFYVLNKMH